MANKRKPRKGSMQYWPRKRARRQYPRVRYWAAVQDAKPLGFAGYKAGMSHIMAIDNRKFSKTKGQEISIPVTILECPPIKVASMRLYKNTSYGIKASTEIMAKVEKDLERKIAIPKKIDDAEIQKRIESIKPEEYHDLTLIVYTQPRLSGIG